MDLTWRDLVSSLALAAMLVVYAAYLHGGAFRLIASTWATAAVLLILGLCGRIISLRGDSHASSQERFRRVLRITAAVFGIIALLAGLTAVVLDSAYALKILIMTSIVVWCSGVCSHI